MNDETIYCEPCKKYVKFKTIEGTEITDKIRLKNYYICLICGACSMFKIGKPLMEAGGVFFNE